MTGPATRLRPRTNLSCDACESTWTAPPARYCGRCGAVLTAATAPRQRRARRPWQAPALAAATWLLLGSGIAVTVAALWTPPTDIPLRRSSSVELPTPAAAAVPARAADAAAGGAPVCRDGDLAFDCVVWATPLEGAAAASFATQGHVFAAPQDGTVRAFSLADGAPVWASAVGSRRLALLPPLADGVPVVHESGGRDGDLTVIEVDDGAERWSAADVAAGRDFITAVGPWLLTLDDGVVRTLSIGNGRLGWQHRLSDGEYARLMRLGTLVLDVADGAVAVLHSNVPDERWRVPLPQPRLIVGVDEHAVYVATGDGRVHALQTSTGRALWQTPAFDDAVFTSATGVGDLVVLLAFTLDGTGHLLALDAFEGDLTWRRTVDVTAANFDPILLPGTVLVRTDLPDAGLHAYDTETGRRLWSTALDGRPREVAVSGATVVIADDAGLSGVDLRPRDGRVRWRLPLPGARIVHDQPLIVAGADALMALDPLALAPHRFEGD